MSRYTAEPNCRDCGRRKGPKQRDQMRCYTCQVKAKRASQHNAHASRVLEVYGITGDEYWALKNYQGGVCAICCKATGRSKRLAVDHNHKCPTKAHDPKNGCPECVRGLLCSTCNQFIGWIGDDPRGGERIARYLTDPPYQILRRRRE